MVELVLLACVLTQPAKCEEVHPPFQEPMRLERCLREGQLVAMRWSRAHPEWRVKGWVCGSPRA